MKNQDLTKELKNKINRTRFREGFKGQLFNSHLIEKMQIDLLTNLLSANDYDFNMYLSFLLKFSKTKKGFLNYEDKLSIISNYLILNMGIINTSELMNLLIDTDLIENPDIIRFSYNFLNISDIEKVDALTNILYSLNGKLNSLNLRHIFGLVNKVNDSKTLFQITHLFEKNIIKDDKNLNDYLKLIYENTDNYNLEFFMRLLYIREVREIPNIKELLKKYILNINNSNVNMNDINTKNEIFLAIFKNLDMLESHYLENVLDFVNSCDTSYYPIIRNLINNKNMFKDRNFYVLFQALKETKTEIERDFLISIMKNPRIISSELQIKAGLEFLKKTKDENKLVAFYKLFIVGPLKDDSLYSEFSILMQDNLLKCKTKEQTLSLIKLAPTLKTSKFKYDILKIVLNTNNNYALEIYPELLKISYVKEDLKTLDLMKKLTNLENESQLMLIRKLVSVEKIFKNNNFNYLVDEVLRKRNMKLVYPLTYIDLFKEPNNEILFENNIFLKFWDIVLNIKNHSQFNFLINMLKYKKLLLDNKNIEIIKDFISSNKEEYKFKYLEEYIRNNSSKDKEFTLDSDRSKTIIMLLKDCKTDYQALSLIKVSKLVKDSSEEADLLVRVICLESEDKCNELISLLEIPNVLESPKFKEILYHYDKCDDLMQKNSILELLNIDGIMESDYLIGYLMIIRRLKTLPQIQALLKVLSEYPDLKDYELFTFCKRIMFITNQAKLILVGEMIIVSKSMPYELTDLVIEKIVLADSDKMIETVEYVGNLITKYHGEESPDIENLLIDLKHIKTLRKK